MFARFKGVMGRPRCGRPTLARRIGAALAGELTLIVLFAAAPVSLADDVTPAPSAAGTPTTQTDPAPAPPADTTTTDAPAPAPAPAPPTAAPVPSDPGPAPVPTQNPTASTTTDPAPAPTPTTTQTTAGPASGQTAPQTGGTTQTAPTPSTADAGTTVTANPSDGSTGSGVTAQNQAVVVQAIWQEQVGCQTYCYATTMTQTATQTVTVNQTASAGSYSSTTPTVATAINEAQVVQVVFQKQIGCVAFCYDTTQTQAAVQDAYVVQIGTADGVVVALVVNTADGFQVVFQDQTACQQECYGATATQSAGQVSTTQQSGDSSSTIDQDAFFAAVAAIAQNIGATFETIIQSQIADCLDHCRGGAQIQAAEQGTAITQAATADLTDPESGAAPQAPPPVTPVTSPATGDSPTDPNPAPPDATEPATPLLGPPATAVDVAAAAPLLARTAVDAVSARAGATSGAALSLRTRIRARTTERVHGSSRTSSRQRVLSVQRVYSSSGARAETKSSVVAGVPAADSTGRGRPDAPARRLFGAPAGSASTATPDGGGTLWLLLLAPAVVAVAGFGMRRFAGSFGGR